MLMTIGILLIFFSLLIGLLQFAFRIGFWMGYQSAIGDAQSEREEVLTTAKSSKPRVTWADRQFLRRINIRP